MKDLDSAESTTRYLRSSTEPLADIVDVAHSLLGSDKVYLPNLHIFLFELVCDRLNDSNSKAFKNWKYSPKVWELLLETWNILSNQKSLRNSRYKQLRLVEVLSTVLRHSKDEQLLAVVFSTIKTIMGSSFIEVDEVTGIELLSSYVSSILDSHDAMINSWTSIICDIYQIPFSRINHKFNKKHTTKFYNECLAGSLKIATSSNPDMKATRDSLISIVSGVINNKEAIGYLNQNTTTFLKTKDYTLSEEMITLFFQLVIHSHSKDLKVCEDVFTTISKNSKLPCISENLLEILTKVNKIMSSEFLNEIYEKEFTTAKKVNWGLVGHLIDLDVDLAMEKSNDIFSKVSHTKGSLPYTIGDKIVRAHIKAREFSKFLQVGWPLAIKQSKIWALEEFMATVSKHTNELSSSQIPSVIQSLRESGNSQDNSPIITALVKGLINCPIAKIDAVKSALQAETTKFDIVDFNSSYFWACKYYTECIYGDEDGVTQVNIDTSKETPSKYYYFSIFRFLELGKIEKHENYTKDFFKYIQAKNTTSETLLSILKRWLVLFNSIFNKGQLNQLISISFSKLDEKDLLGFMETYGNVLFEQSNFVEVLVSHVTQELQNDNSTVANLGYLTRIPIQCYSRSQKIELLELTFKIATNGDDTNSILSRKCLKHLLAQPSYKSTIEVKFGSLLDLIKTSGSEEATSISLSICRLVWTFHLNAHAETTNEEYISSTFKSLTKFFNKINVKQLKKSLPVEFEAGLAIISTTSFNKLFRQEIESLSIALTKAVIFLLNNYSKHAVTHLSDINWLLTALYSIPKDLLTVDINTDIKEIGRITADMESTAEVIQLRTNIFKLKCHILQPTFNNSVYLQALYYSLVTRYNIDSSDLSSANETFLASLEESIYQESHMFLLYSIEHEITVENLSVFFPLLLCFLNTLKKDCQVEHSRILGYSLASLSNNFDLISKSNDRALIIQILQSLRKCLNETNWAFNQHSLETTMTLITKFATSFVAEADDVEIYVLLTQVVSHVLLFHRFRLTSRHHIVMAICITLLEPLTAKKTSKKGTKLSNSQESAAAFSRLMGNLCEPPNTTAKASSKTALSSSSALLKKSLRKHLPVLLVSFIYLSLKFNFKSEIMETLQSGIFKVFDVLSSVELQLVSSTLDIPGRTYYKSLYTNYKDNGKWTDV